MVSLRAIMFDSGCNVLAPGGPRLDAGSEVVEEESSSNAVLTIVLVSIGAVVLGILLFICIRRTCCSKRLVEGEEVVIRIPRSWKPKTATVEAA